ncbi:MAG: chromosomal replication initiator protein DnaA [Desulfobacteraceae bacterium]|nr:chromosomal replication initiator protein DnaA [Desulfobacteraceae bacterium]
MESSWEKVKLEMKQSLPDHSYRMWIQPMGFLESGANVVKLSCPNSFSKKRIRENYLAGLEAQFRKLGCADTKIDLMVETAPAKKKAVKKSSVKAAPGKTRTKAVAGTFPAVSAAPRRTNRPRQMTLPGLNLRCDSGRMLKKGYTFDRFVVGDNCDFAYSAALSLAQHGSANNGALYLLSDTGLGKSHLSQAVGHHVMSQGVSDKVYYVTAEDFTNEMVSALKDNTINYFKEKYRKKCDVLILEDVHFLSGKDATQKELAMTLDYLLDAEKKIIFSGCYLPDEIPKMNEQLKSRLTLGLVTKIDTPDFKTRVKILKNKSSYAGYVIPNDVTDYLAQELCDNVRQLESGLMGVARKGALMGEKIDINLAQSVLSTIARNRKAITVDSIKKLVCTEYSLSEQELVSPSRKKRVVKPRQVAIFLSRKYTDQPLKQIGRSFNRYHATAIYSINAVEKQLKQQGIFSEQMNHLYRKIETGRLK